MSTQYLCPVEELKEKRVLGCRLDNGTELILVWWQDKPSAYLNRCPHLGLPLNMLPNQFFNLDKTALQCSNHMAQFDPGTGVCLAGPCIGASLLSTEVISQDGLLYLKKQIAENLYRP